MEEYTNKYMQVFDTYDEFAQNSADYVKGEDHIAYLIQENEVIYWLYLEQVWRPLNVRTTKTGELEDGRTKVAVRLEYVEGGQKYTSVPNIPDPERITSMAHFLEDYPDIEEVNVTGTTNLTDLSYAFAGSKIKDFSMLDTSKVNIIHALFYETDTNDSSFEITTNVEDLNIESFIVGAKINTLILNIPNAKSIRGNLANSTSYIKKLIVNWDKDKYTYVLSGGGMNAYLRYLPNCEYIKYPNLKLNIENIIANKEITIETNKLFIASSNDTRDASTLNIITDYINYEYFNNSHTIHSKWLLKNNNITINVYNYYKTFSNPFAFGYGIQGNYDIITTDVNYVLHNFWLTTPIVDDAFYAKYNHPVSIFQYKTTFEEVADVNITEATDSSLIYVDWNSIDFDTSNMSIEIHNNINFDINDVLNIKKLIIDFDNNLDYENAQIGKFFSNINHQDESYISGTFKSGYNTNYTGKENTIVYNIDELFKNCTFYNYRILDLTSIAWLDYMPTFNNIKLITDSNDEYQLYTIIQIDDRMGRDSGLERVLDLTSFVIDNKLYNNVLTSSYTSFYPYVQVKYLKDVQLVITPYNVNSRYVTLLFYIDWLKNSTSEKPIIIKKPYDIVQSTMLNTTSNKANNDVIDIENIYLYCEDEGYITNVVETYSNIIVNITNILGRINLYINYNTSEDGIGVQTNLRHIDVNSVCVINGAYILKFRIVDDETTINLITKLIDNTSSFTKTIYMYRSQANIIGDDNIAAAVAKNYEFAIIEN